MKTRKQSDLSFNNSIRSIDNSTRTLMSMVMTTVPIRYNDNQHPWTLGILRRLAAWQGHRCRQVYEHVEHFVAFVGSSRSGSTLIGALLDAHPEVVIGHEANAFGCVRDGLDREGLYWFLMRNSQGFAKTGAEWTDYKYAVPDQWQGRVQKLRIIGDKKASATTRQLTDDPDLLNRLVRTVGVPVSLIHTIRNPFDVLATRFRRSPNFSLMDHSEKFFQQCDTLKKLKTGNAPPNMIDVYHEELIRNPEKELRRLLTLTGAELDDNYLASASAIVNDRPNQSRHSCDWTAEQIRLIERRMDEYEFLSCYSFDDGGIAAA
tara:strand:+ start:60237 stop:61193 length:957 start_codon:yes stop_codon:yes gene_type:complete